MENNDRKQWVLDGFTDELEKHGFGSYKIKAIPDGDKPVIVRHSTGMIIGTINKPGHFEVYKKDPVSGEALEFLCSIKTSEEFGYYIVNHVEELGLVERANQKDAASDLINIIMGKYYFCEYYYFDDEAFDDWHEDDSDNA